jgi:Tetracyclin repressor-like, C-terminal domain
MEKQQIREAYKIYWLENGCKPASIYAFCKQINLEEKEFYSLYTSFDAIEKDIWLAIFNDTLHQLKNDETYRSYSAQEKLLAFYFLWVQKLKDNRSYILLQKENCSWQEWKQDRLETFRREFYGYVASIIKGGYETKEIKERKFISDQYKHGFWVQALFVLKYWIEDNSENFEMTDAAIEKAVNLSFQLISSNTLDSIVDFGKFILTKK